MEAELQVKALGSATGRWHGAWLLGLAVTDSLVVDIIVTFGLRGLPSDSFWIVWPIMALIVLTAALFAAVLGRLAAPVETFLTVNFYGLVLLSISLAAATLWRYLASHRELLDPKLTDADIRSITVITKPNMGCYVAIVALAFLVPTVAAFGYLVISLFALFRQRDDSVATGGSSSSSAR
jgi:hypothetical protein